MSVLRKLEKKYGNKDDGQKENHDPFDTSRDPGYLNINCYDQNGKQNKQITKQNTKTKDEWDSNQHLTTKHSANTFSIHALTHPFDEFELTKKKKPNQTISDTSNNTSDIWLTISSKRKKMIDINLYRTSNVSLIPNNIEIYLRNEQNNLNIYDHPNKNEIKKGVSNTSGDILIKINFGNAEACDPFFQFVEYLHQNKPGDRYIPNSYNKVNKPSKSAQKYKHISSLNNTGYTPTVPKPKSKSVGKRGTNNMTRKQRAHMMATAGRKVSNPHAAKAAEQRYQKCKKTPAATTIDRRKLQFDNFQNKKQFKTANYPKPGKDAGKWMERKVKGRNIYVSRHNAAKNGNINARKRLNKTNTDNFMIGCGAFGAGYGPYGYGNNYGYSRSCGNNNVLHSRYRDRSGEQIGFKNLGNTCYINAILRSINSLQCLSNDFRRKYIFDLCGRQLYAIDSVYRSYLELLLKDMNNINKEILDPWIFKKIIGKMDDMFSTYTQQDAHELLSFLLNALHDHIFKGITTYFSDENNNNNNNELEKQELEWLSPIHSNFHFEIEFEYECTKCGYKRNKIESFRELSLDLPLRKHEKKEEEKETKDDEKKDEQKEEKEEKQQQEDLNNNNSNNNDIDMNEGKNSKSSKEEMDEDEKEEIEPPKPKELTPFEKLRDDLIRQSDGGCPSHAMQNIEFKEKGSKLIMYCISCNNAIIEQINNPANIVAPRPTQTTPIPPFGHNNRNNNTRRDYNGIRINNWTLNELLRAYFVKKTLEYKCEHNGCMNNKVYVTSWFKQIPRVLVFHIKRFVPNYNTNSYTKSHDKVKIEKTIDVNMFCNQTLSLPPDSFEQLNNNNEIVNENICNHGNDIYHKIFRNQSINSLEICKRTKDLPVEMQTALNKQDYKDKNEQKDEDDDIVILNNNNNQQNKNVKQEDKENKSNEQQQNEHKVDNNNNNNNIPPLIGNINNMNINVSSNDNVNNNNNMEPKSEYMTDMESKQQAALWTAMDPGWEIYWTKYKCEQTLKEQNSDKTTIDYAKMYLRYHKSIEYHNNNNNNNNIGMNGNAKKRKRDDPDDYGHDENCNDDSDYKQPQAKKQKTDATQPTITDAFAKQRQNQNNNNNNHNYNTGSGSGYRDDNDSDFQKALANSLIATYTNNDMNYNNTNSHNTNSNNNTNNKSQATYKGVKPSIENSGNINQFKSVCDEEFLPNSIDWTQYNLRCIVRHLGNNYTSGHYVTDVLTINNNENENEKNKNENKNKNKVNWMRHDDQYVSSITDENATNDKAQKNAYIFFYVHQSAAQ